MQFSKPSLKESTEQVTLVALQPQRISQKHFAIIFKHAENLVGLSDA